MLPSPPPLRTQRASFPALRSSNAKLSLGFCRASIVVAVLLGLRCLYDTGLEPLRYPMAFSPVFLFPRLRSLRKCTYLCYHLLASLKWFYNRSRSASPSRCLPAFAAAELALASASLIRSITERHSLSLLSFTGSPISSPYGSLSQRGDYGLIVFRVSNKSRLGSVCTPTTL